MTQIPASGSGWHVESRWTGQYIFVFAGFIGYAPLMARIFVRAYPRRLSSHS